MLLAHSSPTEMVARVAPTGSMIAGDVYGSSCLLWIMISRNCPSAALGSNPEHVVKRSGRMIC